MIRDVLLMLNEFLAESLLGIGSAGPQLGETVDHITVMSNGVVVVPSSFTLLPLLLGQQVKDGTCDLTLFISADDPHSHAAVLFRND
jgi:hypothetical protein